MVSDILDHPVCGLQNAFSLDNSKTLLSSQDPTTKF